jgi:hypothetical protein
MRSGLVVLAVLATLLQAATLTRPPKAKPRKRTSRRTKRLASEGCESFQDLEKRLSGGQNEDDSNDEDKPKEERGLFRARVGTDTKERSASIHAGATTPGDYLIHASPSGRRHLLFSAAPLRIRRNR